MAGNIEKPLTLNLKGKLFDFSQPLVMGILNATPDSFYAASRCETKKAIVSRAYQILSEGAEIIDIGAYSSRPNAEHISPEEEKKRLAEALELILKHFPNSYISVDTFRADVARFCVEEYGVAVINDISGGELDQNMFTTVADLKVPYIMMHMRGTPQTMLEHTAYDNLIEEMMLYFSKKIERLACLGVCDIIIDPGFGFSKTLDDNYFLMHHLSDFKIFGLPILSGISRKSMIYKFLGETPAESLNGTTVLNTLSIIGGADILRVHDVKEAVETVKIVTKTFQK